MKRTSVARAVLAGVLLAGLCHLHGCNGSRNRRGATGTLLVFSTPNLTVDEDAGFMEVTVRRTGSGNGAVGVDFATSDGTGTAGSDYDSTSGTLVWSDGDLTGKSFPVVIRSDLLIEGDETITLTLSNPTGGATLGSPAVATLTILDAQLPGTIQFDSATHDVGEVSGTATVRVTRTGGGGAVSVDYSSSAGTAAGGVDYLDASGTLTWGDGDTADKTFSISMLDDTLPEGPETVLLTLANAAGGASLGVPMTAVLTIVDNGGPPAWTSSGDGQANASYGLPVASAGDVNDDGYDHVIIGASRFDATSLDAGKAYVYIDSP